MKYLAAAVGIAALASLANAQHVTEQQRLDSIWYAATTRISQQSDLWYKHGEYLKSIQLLKLETSVFPYDSDSISLLGWFQQSTQDEAGELATYVNFRRNNPNDPEGPYLEAAYYYRKKLYAKVPPLLEPLIAMKPAPHPNVYRELAHCYEDMDLLADAKRVWQSYLVLAPSDAAAKINLDRVEKKLKGQVPMDNRTKPPSKP